MDFQRWMNEEADMPIKDENGQWYDLETGLYFKDFKETVYRNENPLLARTKKARELAKKYKGTAIKGSAAQKDWAEDLRKSFLEKLSEEDRFFMMSLDYQNNCKFWIETRNQCAIELTNALKIIQIVKKEWIACTDSNKKNEYRIEHQKLKETINFKG